MTATRTGIVIGAVLALTWVVFGFWSAFFVAVAMTIGALVGRVVDGRLSLAAVAEVFSGRRSSS